MPAATIKLGRIVLIGPWFVSAFRSHRLAVNFSICTVTSSADPLRVVRGTRRSVPSVSRRLDL
jgi:hypothetical protein